MIECKDPWVFLFLFQPGASLSSEGKGVCAGVRRRVPGLLIPVLSFTCFGKIPSLSARGGVWPDKPALVLFHNSRGSGVLS